MILNKKINLVKIEENSERVYQIELQEIFGNEKDRYLVNFCYGRKGTTLRESTKTQQPVNLQNAESIFSNIIQLKLKEGYAVDQRPERQTLIANRNDTSESSLSKRSAIKQASLVMFRPSRRAIASNENCQPTL